MVAKNIALIFNYFALNIKKEFQYKTAFFMQVFTMILNDAFFIIQWQIIFSIVDNIGGYGFREVMLLWSIMAGGYGVAHSFFGGTWNIKNFIYDGKLDVYLTQPKNVLINVCCSATNVGAIGDMIYAFVVLVIIGAPWWWYLLMIPVIFLVGILFISIYVCYISLSFYVRRADALASMVEGTIMKAANYPPMIFTGIVKWLFFTLIPTFFFSFVPAQNIFLSFNIGWIALLLGVVTLWTVMAFLLFNRGLRRYNSGSLMGGRL